jgi:hypothetical protein
MKNLTLGLALGAVLGLGLATSAQAASTETTWSASATGSTAGGSKSAPAPFSGAWNLTATNNVDPSYRPATPSSWTWSWEGVTLHQKGIPSCPTDQINDAKSVAGCPPGSHIGVGPIPAAVFGPTGLAEGPNTECLGKTYDLYNGKPGELTVVVDGPPEQCATLGFLGAYPITLATSGGRTSMTWSLPENLQHPFPGAEGALRGGGMVFNNIKASAKSAGASEAKKRKKARKSNLFTSVNCKGPREFTFTVVDTFGTHVSTSSAGNCKAPKKRKKK